ncbi:MAG: hypothetical protein E7161_01815 [Firmicutes bacterium]|nr:hypothetical protein [Bacillota bacterium]
MQKLFEDFLYKKINPKELVSKLIKAKKYVCYTDTQSFEFNLLINDIQDIIDNRNKKDVYEDILIVFYQYLDIKKNRKNKTIFSLKILEKPVYKSGIKIYYNEKDIMCFMSSINYGWLGEDNFKRNLVDNFFSDYYILQTPRQVAKNKIGVCWDQVELERYYFNNTEYKIKTYFLCHYDNEKCPTHTFLVYEKNSCFYWFEHSWEKYRGIHKYSCLKDLLIDVRNKFIETELNNTYESNNLMLYEYEKPKYGISVKEFYKHCANGKNINVDSL